RACDLVSVLSVTAPVPSPPFLLSLHDALPILRRGPGHYLPPAGEQRRSLLDETQKGTASLRLWCWRREDDTGCSTKAEATRSPRSEKHTPELPSPTQIVCRLFLSKKNKITHIS